MKYRAFFMLLALGIFSACSTNSNTKDDNQLISQLERAGSNLERDSILSLKNSTKAYLNSDRIDDNEKAKALYHYGLMLDRNRKFNDAATAMKDLITSYPDTEFKDDALYSLVNIYKVKLRSPKVAAVLSEFLLEVKPDHGKKDELASNIENNYEGADNVISALSEAALVKQDNGNIRVDRKNAKNLIFLSQMYASFRPDSDKSKEYLHTAAEFARSIAENEELLNILNVLVEKYPNSKEGQEALFLKAFYYENNLKDIDGARALYQDFIDKYPNNDFADDAEFLIKNLGKSEEEILKSFEQAQ